MKVKRSLRIAELLKRDISGIIATRVRDSLVKSVLITYVKVSDDLKHARIYYRTLQHENELADIDMALVKVTNFLRLELGKMTNLRYVPELKFFYDNVFDEANRIDSLLEKLKEED
ncbi:ribosome-binding factor A [candidate division KSB1 bacterium 4484_87]|nr:MAG: ribosome-binding factor A [candidate division KSB1 bacterium 4484_87]